MATILETLSDIPDSPVQAVIATAQAIAKGGPRRQYKWNKKAANDTNQMNRDNAIWALEQNKRLQQEQRVYDSPQAQMARYKEAGLNPHLIYGSGSSSGQAFPISTGGIAPSRIDAPSASYPDVPGSFLQAGQTIAQTGLSQQKTAESEMKTGLMDAQTQVLQNNPYYDSETAKRLTSSAVATAAALEQKANWNLQTTGSVKNGEALLNASLQHMWTELNLDNGKMQIQAAELALKAETLKSAEFNNWMNEQKKKFLASGDINPGMWLDFFKQVILKFM